MTVHTYTCIWSEDSILTITLKIVPSVRVGTIFPVSLDKYLICLLCKPVLVTMYVCN